MGTGNPRIWTELTVGDHDQDKHAAPGTQFPPLTHSPASAFSGASAFCRLLTTRVPCLLACVLPSSKGHSGAGMNSLITPSELWVDLLRQRCLQPLQKVDIGCRMKRGRNSNCLGRLILGCGRSFAFIIGWLKLSKGRHLKSFRMSIRFSLREPRAKLIRNKEVTGRGESGSG